MAHEKSKNCLTGFVLAWLISWGVAGSLVTGLELDVERMGALFWLCGVLAAVSALCFCFRWGGLALACLLAGAGWLLWRDGRIVQQTLFLLKRLMTLCKNAYGWGMPELLRSAGDPGTLFLPVAVLASVPAIGISRTVCRRGDVSLGMLAAVLPMALCFLVTDTVPETKYLYFWMLGITLLLLTQGARRVDASQGVTLTTIAAVPVALALGLLFWLVPREGYDQHPEQLQERIVNWVREMPELWEDTSDRIGEALSGAVQPSEVNLRTLGPRLRREYPVMEVTAPQSGTLYLRGQDYDVYDGMGWTASRMRSETLTAQGLVNSGNVSISTRRTRDILYLPYYPGGTVTLLGGCVDNTGDRKAYSFAMWSPRYPDAWRQQIREAEQAQPDSGAVFATSSAVRAQDDRRYLTLPNETQKWAQELLNTILTDEKTATAAADTIAEYVKNSAPYDLDTPRMTGKHEDFVRWFLEESETGYCVHFATAAAVLLRAAGVEARYVEGYMATVQAGVEATVTEDQAHAWVEYYEPIVDAWIVLEATPPDLTQQEQPAEPATRPEEQTAPPTEAALPTEPPPDTQPGESSGPQEEEAPPKAAGIPGWMLWPSLGAAAAAMIWWQRKLRLELRRRRLKKGGSNARALQRWQEIEALCRLLKTPCPEEMEQLAQKAKYSLHSISAEELRAMDTAIRTCQERLVDTPWYKKLLYKYFFAAF